MKRLVTNALFCFLHPLFLLSSFCILDFNNKIRPDRRTNGRTDGQTDGHGEKNTSGQTDERTHRGVAESASQITGAECRIGQTHAPSDFIYKIRLECPETGTFRTERP